MSNKIYEINFFFRFSYFFSSIFVIAVLSTLVELYATQPSEYYQKSINCSKFLNFAYFFPDELLISFSLCKNTKALFNITPNPNDISIIHGIRFINAALLLISHKSMALFFNPHTNRTKMIEVWKNHLFTIQCHYMFCFCRILANMYQ